MPEELYQLGLIVGGVFVVWGLIRWAIDRRKPSGGARESQPQLPPAKETRALDDQFVPMAEATLRAYEELREIGSMWSGAADRLAARPTGMTREEAALVYMAGALKTKHVPMYGAHPPSRKRELIDRAEFNRGSFGDAGATFTYFMEKEPNYVDIAVRERDLTVAIEAMKGDSLRREVSDPNKPEPNMQLDEVVKRITGRDKLPLPIEEGSVDLIYACNQIREKALNDLIVIFGCTEWRSTQPKDYDHMVRSRIPAEYWRNHKIDAADSFGTDPILRRGITSKITGGWDKTEYLWLWFDRSQVETQWPG
jgi:hypothetical protein